MMMMAPEEVVERAVLTLAGQCDYAHAVDGVGFNRYDAGWGHEAAGRIASGTGINHVSALKVVTKYRKQLQRAGIELPPVEVVTERHAARRAQEEASKPKPPQGVEIAREGGVLAIRFPYDPDRVNIVRELPGRRWNPATKAWTVPAGALDAAMKAFPDATLMGELGAELEAARAAAAEAERVRLDQLQQDLARLDVVLAGLTRKPYEHQEAGVQWLIEQRHGLLADDMGLGKTYQALVAAKVLGHQTLVIAPAGLRVNWFREAEAVEWPIGVHSWAKVPPAPEGLKYTLLVDEAHYGQNLKAARTKRFLELAKHAQAVFLLTGTPIKNGRPSNLYPLLVAIRHELAKNRKGYEVHYCNAGPTRFSAWDVSGAAHLDELHRKISDGVLRRMKDECLDLPEKVRVVETAELSVEAQRRYNETLDQLQAEYRARVERGEISSQGDKLVMLNHLRHAGSLAKVDAAVEKAEEVVEQGGSVVLFTAFKDSAEQIAARIGAEQITGDVGAEERQAAIDRFQSGERKAIVCTLGAGNVGITLTAAQTVILVDRPWTPGDAIQAEDRCHRIGQRGSVLALWLQTGAADVAIDALLQQKHERIELVLAGKRKTLRGLASVGDIADAILGGKHE